MKYVIYIRKSTDTEDKQVLSLDAQRNELLDLAKRLGLNVVKVYEESMSAKSVGRPVFNQVLSDIQKKKADAILCWKLDRLARNMIDGGQIMDMLQKNTIQQIQTFERTYLPHDDVLLMSVQFGMANQFLLNLSRDVKRGNREKLKRGDWINQAPFGYLNDKANKTIVIDPVRAPYVQQMFELYATGLYSYKKISDLLFEQGLRSKGGLKIHAGTIQRIITRTFYYGVMTTGGKAYQGNHEPLVTQNIFNICQEISGNKSRPRAKTKGFTLSGFGQCQGCGCATTAEIKKGKYIYYHCTNGKGICDQKKYNTNQKDIHNSIVSDMEQLYISDKMIDIVYKAKLEELEQSGDYTNHALDSALKARELLVQRKSRLVDTYTAGDIDQHLYKEKLQSIDNEHVKLSNQIDKLEQDNPDPKTTIELVYSYFKAGNTMAKRYMQATEEEKRIIASDSLSNFILHDRQVVAVQYKNPYSVMRKAHKNVNFSQMLPQWC